MANQQLVNWIRNEEFRGHSAQQIYRFLVQKGYSSKDASEAISLAYGNKKNSQFPIAPKPKISLEHAIMGFFAILIIGGGVLYFTMNKGAFIKEGTGTAACADINCLKEKFKNCQKAAVTSELAENIVYYFEILGAKDGLCEVKLKSTANPNPELIGKEMTCRYDSSKEFETAIQDISSCQGALHKSMTGG